MHYTSVVEESDLMLKTPLEVVIEASKKPDVVLSPDTISLEQAINKLLKDYFRHSDEQRVELKRRAKSRIEAQRSNPAVDISYVEGLMSILTAGD